ncbi:hypothetical protein MMX123_02022 [Microbacterium sp. MM2322]|uniref:hypothetical protein n=1 Tax=Microbacterium sp. MM2322 TaxID=3157631 RepID=UPI003D804197
MTRRRVHIALSALTALVLLAGCSGPPEIKMKPAEPTASEAASIERKNTPVPIESALPDVRAAGQEADAFTALLRADFPEAIDSIPGATDEVFSDYGESMCLVADEGGYPGVSGFLVGNALLPGDEASRRQQLLLEYAVAVTAFHTLCPKHAAIADQIEVDMPYPGAS